VEVRDFEEWLRRGVENEQCLGFLNDKDILETIGSSRKPCGDSEWAEIIKSIGIREAFGIPE
jgi:hypothetical protein